MKTEDKQFQELTPGVKPVVNDIHSYHRVKDELEDGIRIVCMYQNVLDSVMIDKLQGVVGRARGNVTFDVSEIDMQYQLLLNMQKQVVNPDGNILATADFKDMSSMISSFNSLLALFMKSRKEIDGAREDAKLKEAVLSAIRDLPTEAQSKFFKVMEGD